MEAADEEHGELLLSPPSTASQRPGRLLRPAVMACATAGCATAAVACWRRGVQPELGGGDGPEEGLIADFAVSFTCSGAWPERWFEHDWEQYCAKPNARAWAMTHTCNYGSWRWGYSSTNEAEDTVLAKCNKGSGGPKCFVFDRNGEKCKGDYRPSHPEGPVPSVVQWGPPFEGTFEVTQGPHECKPTHCDGGINEDAVDISMPKGTHVIAGRPGVVVRTADGHGDGAPCKSGHSYKANMVGIKAEDGTEDQYLHLSAGSLRVKRGDHVDVGQVLALSGNSGCSSGPHLHVHTLNPNFRNSVDMAFTIPCSHMDKDVAKHFQVWCNDANCTCISTSCDRKTWDDSKLADWAKYCRGPNGKAWVTDSVCNYYGWWTGSHSAVAMAKEQCESNCHLIDENGHDCH